MGVYTRFKKNKEGIRQLVELLESTPLAKREKMIQVGMDEDPDYTHQALALMMTFDDVMNLGDMELAELLATVPGRTVGNALYKASDEVKARFIAKAPPPKAIEAREILNGPEVPLSMIGGAQLKMVEATRALERRGVVKVKRIVF